MNEKETTYFVWAGDITQMKNLMIICRIKNHIKMKYLHSAEQLYGLEKIVIIKYGSWYENKNSSKITEFIENHRIKVGVWNWAYHSKSIRNFLEYTNRIKRQKK